MTKRPEPRPHLLAVQPYVAGKRKASAEGKVIKLSSNENPYGPSPKAAEAYKAAAADLHRYGDSHAVELRETIAEVQGLPAEQIVCGSGSDELISLLIHCYASNGGEVLFTKHAFAMYRIYSMASGAIPVEVEETNLHADVDKLLTGVTDSTKIVFLANPNNPTGTYLPASEVKRLRDGLPEDVLLVIDGAYAEFMTQADYTDGRELVAAGENTVMLRTFSKVYGLPALRLGWGYFPPAVADILNRARSPFNINAAAMAAGVAAMRDQAYLQEMVAKNNAKRDALTASLTQLGYEVVPSCGNFILVKSADAKALNAHLLSKQIIVREMGGYHLPDYLRISIGTTEENAVLLAEMEQFLKGADVA